MRIGLSLLTALLFAACNTPVVKIDDDTGGDDMSNGSTGDKGTTTITIPGDLLPSLAAVASQITGTVPLEVHFSASTAGGDLVAAAGLQITWNFGDGSAAETQATPTHTFSAVGVYTVTATVTDADGDKATATITITTTAPPSVNLPPTAVAT